jgi:hypothetical protein
MCEGGSAPSSPHAGGWGSQLPASSIDAAATQVCIWDMGRSVVTESFWLVAAWRAAAVGLQLHFELERGQHA